MIAASVKFDHAYDLWECERWCEENLGFSALFADQVDLDHLWNLQRLGNYHYWHFAREEDATLFALKFA